MAKANKNTPVTNPSRPPIVAVLGHVDHGKTTLLDTIRKTSVTTSEAGGITQHIGAYQIKIKNQKSKIKNDTEKTITFIDTPGHEAFTKMRSRGSSVADIAVLVVAANDGVMPQTIESIKIIKEAGIPFVVAVNKIDLPDVKIDRIKQQLAVHEVLVEGYGGDVVVAPVSAKTGKGVAELLDLLILVGEMRELAADPNGPLTGILIEVTKDKRRGITATLIVKNGTLKVGDTLYAETVRAHVRALFDDHGQPVTVAPPSFPVEVLGWDGLPPIGATVSTNLTAIPQVEPLSTIYSLEMPPVETINKLKILLRTDVAGSLEAILASFGEGVEIVSATTGEIHESDIMTAKSTGAFVIGFNVKPAGNVLTLARLEKVKVKTYKIIYELLDEVREVVDLLNKPEEQEQVLGEATIVAEFKFQNERVAGCKVTTGRIVRSDLIKVMRKDVEVGRGRIKSLRQGKNDVPKIEAGGECGLMVDKKLDFKIGDLIIAYKLHELLA